MPLFDRSRAAVDDEPLTARLPAHRHLATALLRVDQPWEGAPYSILWQDAAAEQRDHDPSRSDEAVERALELLVTEVRALEAVSWFDQDHHWQQAALAETIAYWATGDRVTSAPAHAAWQRCWETRTAVAATLPLDGAGVSAFVNGERRLQREWTDRWHEW